MIEGQIVMGPLEFLAVYSVGAASMSKKAHRLVGAQVDRLIPSDG